MFGTILKTRITRWVCIGLIASLAFSVYNTALPLRAYAQDGNAKLKVAAVGIENLTKESLFDEKHGADMLMSELTDVEGIELIPEETVVEALNDLEPNPNVAISVGEAIGADTVMVGFVSDIKFAGTEQAEAEVGISLYSVADGNLLSEALVVGRTTRLGFTGTKEDLALLAVKDGVRNATGFVFENMNHFGVVTMVKGTEVYTNMAERDNIRVGAELAVMRDNKQIASVEVKEASIAHSVGTIVDQKKGVSIKTGDKVRLVYTPYVKDTTSGGVAKVPKKKKMNPVMIGLLAVGLVALASRGGNKAEEATKPLGSQTVASADGRAVVYSSTPFQTGYVPGVPVKVTSPSSSDLGACLNINNNIKPIISPTTTAYEFYLASNPKSSALPGDGYTLIFDMNGIDISGISDKSNLKCATCNTDLGTWEILESTYAKYTAIGNHYGVSCPVTHFTPYVVIDDERVDPIPKPSNFQIQCGDGKVTLSWATITDSNNINYIIYQCSETSCPTIKDTLAASVTTIEYTVQNDTQVCYAVSGKSSMSGQDAEKTAIECTTPSNDPAVCKINAITLVSPSAGIQIQEATPDFIFIGSGTEDYYILTVKLVETSEVVYTQQIQGEGASSTTGRQTFTQAYGGIALSNQQVYQWQVVGYTNSRGEDLTSPLYTFTYTGGQTGSDCCALSAAPEVIAPDNGVSLQVAQPVFIWAEDECAKYYTLDVRNSDGDQMLAGGKITNNYKQYDGPTLVDNVSYLWQVTAYNGCGEELTGQASNFTKVSSTEVADLPVPKWVDGSLEPVIVGDQIVSLRWYAETDSKVIGYNIYRSKDPTITKSDYLDTVYISQLGSPLPSSKCPFQFSSASPGYCDISVTNGEIYYYKISCIQTGDTPGNLSSALSAQPPLQRPQLIGPGGSVAMDVTADTPDFMWFPINGENIQYILSLVKDSTVIWQPTGSVTSITYSGPALEIGQTYTWTVKAFNSANSIMSDDSQTFRFTKTESATKPDAPYWCGGTHCSPQQSTFYSTDDSNDSIKLYWEKSTSENIKQYYIYRCINTPGICMGTKIATVSNNACNSTTLTKVVCYEDPYLERGADYYYSIVAVDSGGTTSDYTPTSDKITLLFKGPSLVTPVTDQVIYVPEPTFTWLSVSGATHYLIQVTKKADGFSIPSKIIWSFDTGTTTSAIYNSDSGASGPLLNKEPDVAGTEYSWRVCATNDKFPTVESSNCTTRSFYKNLLPPDAISPGNGEKTTLDTITFRWSATPGAAGYTLRICKRTGTGSNCNSLPIVFQTEIDGADTVQYSLQDGAVKFDACNLTLDPNCTCAYSGCTHDGSYYWEIRAYDAYGVASGSWVNADRNLFYKVSSPAPQLIIPTDGQVIGPNSDCGLGSDFYGNPTYNYEITFSWMEQNTSSYVLRVESIEASDDGTASNTEHLTTVFEQTMDINSTNTNTNCGSGGTSYTIPFSAGQRYRWNVTTQNNPYDTSNAREFITGLPAPHLVAPLNNEPVMLDADCDGNSSFLCLHFDWNGGTWTVDGADQEIPGVIGAGSYDIEIYKNGLAVWCDRQVTIPTTTAVTNTTNTFCDLSTASVVNGDTFTWRVRARDATSITTSSGTGIPGPWTPYYQFTVLIPPVTLATPPDSSAVCDPYNDPTGIISNCTVVDCLDMYYSWSPQPHANLACYRIEISDTEDFRNLVWSDNSESPVNTFPCPLKQCYQAGEAEGTYIPMMNGVTYYWRVGSSVTQGTTCGATWVYSDVWEYLKRPPMPKNLNITVTQTSAALTWSAPQDCHGSTSSSSQPISYPDVPPNTGAYVIYLEQQLPTSTSPPTHIIARMSYAATSASLDNLSPDTDYYLCMTTVDGSGFETHPGHVSNFVCAFTHTLPEEEE